MMAMLWRMRNQLARLLGLSVPPSIPPPAPAAAPVAPPQQPPQDAAPTAIISALGSYLVDIQVALLIAEDRHPCSGACPVPVLGICGSIATLRSDIARVERILVKQSSAPRGDE